MTYPQAPTDVNLIFEKASSVVDPLLVNLVFGETSGPPEDVEYDVTFNAKFKLRGSITVDYDNAVWRGVSASVTAPHQEASELRAGMDVPWQPSKAAERVLQSVFDTAKPMTAAQVLAWSIPESGEVHRSADWGTAKPQGAEAAGVWNYGTPAERRAVVPWQEAEPLARFMGMRFGLAKAEHRSATTPWDKAVELPAYFQAPLNQAAKPVQIRTVLPWQEARTLSSYGGRRYLPPPRPVDPAIPPVLQDLRFCALYPEGGHGPGNVTLVFGFNPCGSVTPDAPLFILPARAYMTVHEVSAYLHPTGEPITIFDLRLSADMDSTVWTFSANTPISYFETLMPVSRVPQAIRLVVNGLEWVLLVENLQERTIFGERRASIGGRSKTALLGDPYSLSIDRMANVANTAQQHALDALQFSGVTLDWTIQDWLVAAGAWSHTGTALEAVQTIAQGVGGFVNSHRNLPELIVRHPYPTLPGGIPGGPWNWEGAAGAFAADVELAPDSIRERSVERVDGPDIDGVYVSGTTTGGIERLVRRSGTLGAKLAPMSANPLITAQAAADQLGYSILGLGGPKHKVSLTLPVLTGVDQPGVLEVGQMVQVNDAVPWRGMVRGVEVAFTPPKLVQVVTLERHLMV